MKVELSWEGDQRFAGRTERAAIALDGRAQSGPSPVEALALALAACMAIDVVHILAKGRLEPKALQARLEADRAPTDPKRIVAARLRLTVVGDIPADRIERAIALSRERYCSVWHTLRQDLPFETSFEVMPA
jgi:putative redox protein